jgi:hypothetical protein
MVRNIFYVHLFWPVLISVGLIGLTRGLAEVIEVMGRKKISSGPSKVLSVIAVSALMAFGLPWGNLEANYNPVPESRNQVVKWLEQNVDPGTAIVVPADLLMDLRDLSKQYRIELIGRADIMSGAVRRKHLRSDTILLLPRYTFRTHLSYGLRTRPGLAMGLNRNIDSLLNELEILAVFGVHPVDVDHYRSLGMGNPLVAIAKPKELT